MIRRAIDSFIRDRRSPWAVFVVALVILIATANTRLRRPSNDTHFVAQAEAWLAGRLDIATWPPGADDPARVEEVELTDGRIVRGRFFHTRPLFRAFGGEQIPRAQVRRRIRTIAYNSFPPFPAVLMLPIVAIWGEHANDVWFTVILAAAVPALFFLLLLRLRRAGLIPASRPASDDAWLTLLLPFGTVFFFAAVQGRVWFTAHVVGVLMCILYVLFSIEARHAVLAGLALACAFLTRAPMLFMFPLFVLEAWRVHEKGDWKTLGKQAVLFAAPILVLGALAAWHNHARFGEWSEFGHSYLQVRQEAQIEQYGLFSPQYLVRNLRVAFTLLPRFGKHPPVSISGHGLALWLTTPAFLLLLLQLKKAWRPTWSRALWITTLCVALPAFFYQNSGWVQFGYRFSLDYTVFLVLLLAVGPRPLRWAGKTLIMLSIVVNLFGALTFNKYPNMYRTDAVTYGELESH
jgi:hypothetical protein